MRWIAYLHNRTSLFAKVLVSNAAITVIGGLMAVWIVSRYFQSGQGHSYEVALVLFGLAVSLAVNYAILRLAFQPLFTLQDTLDRVRQGDFKARVPEVQGDPDIARVTETANVMLDQLNEHRQAVAAQILRAMEDERKRIARELHDETAQSLTSLTVHLEVIERQLQNQPEEFLSRLRLTKDIAQRTLDETRRLMFDLRPSVLDDLGLVPAMRWFISQRVMPNGLQVAFESQGVTDRLPDEMETAVFRVMQEAITNSVKHSKAKNLVVTLVRHPDRLVGTVKDDGVGFTPGAHSKTLLGQGLGLFGMQERAALVGGHVQIDSEPGGGTTVEVTLPVRDRRKS